MKNFKLILLLVPAFAMSCAQAGSGKMFGATFGGTLLGTTLGNAIARPSNTVVVTESTASDSRLINRKFRQYDEEMNEVINTVNKQREAIRTLSEEVSDLKSEVNRLKKSKISDKDVVEVKKSKRREKDMPDEETPKKAESKSWFSSSNDDAEEIETE